LWPTSRSIKTCGITPVTRPVRAEGGVGDGAH
jgi:hypothetical protein